MLVVIRGLLTPRRRHWQLIFAILLLKNCLVLPHQRSGSMSVARRDYHLKGHLIYEKDVSSDLQCAQLCLAQSKRCPSCKSVNLQKKQGRMGKRKCQLNNETDENVKSESLVPDVAFNILKWAKLQYSAGNSYEQREREDLGAMKTSKILAANLTYFCHLHQWLSGTKNNWHLCWRATEHGWDVRKQFHTRCDYKVPTVTIVQVGQYVFGGFANTSWEGSGYKVSSGCFLFSLRNKDNLPAFQALCQDNDHAIVASQDWGPGFGKVRDLVISNNADSSSQSLTNFGNGYKPPSGYTFGTDECFSLLPGSRNFTPTEVEVYYLP